MQRATWYSVGEVERSITRHGDVAELPLYETFGITCGVKARAGLQSSTGSYPEELSS